MTISVALSNSKIITYKGDCEAHLTDGHLTIFRYDQKEERQQLAIFAPGIWLTCLEDTDGMHVMEAAA